MAAVPIDVSGPCVLALGPINDHFRASVRDQFFPQYLSDWVVAPDEPLSTDALWQAAQASSEPWRALLVTNRLEGTIPLAGALGAIALRWPGCRIAVLADGDTPDVRALIGQLSVFRIYNVLLETPRPQSLMQLLTETAAWETIAPYLDPTHPVEPPSLPPGAALSLGGMRPIQSAMAATETVVAHQTIAVVSGKGGVGKSGWIANMAVAAAPWGSVILDADYLHPSVSTYFRDPGLPLEIDLRQLITALDNRYGGSSSGSRDWTDADRAATRRYVEQAIQLGNGIQLIPGPSRANPIPVRPPVGLIRELAVASVHMGRITWIDTPSLPTDDVFIDAVGVADRVVCVTTPAYPAVLETIDLLRKLDLLHVPRSKLSLVIMRRGRAGFSTYDLTHVHLAEIPLLGVWPDDAVRWERSLESHKPLATSDPKLWRQALTTLTGLSPIAEPRASKRRRRQLALPPKRKR